MKPTIVDGFKKSISFLMPEYNANKVVVYVVAFVNPQNVEKEIEEIDDVFVCGIEESLEKNSFDDAITLLRKVVKFIA